MWFYDIDIKVEVRFFTLLQKSVSQYYERIFECQSFLKDMDSPLIFSATMEGVKWLQQLCNLIRLL